MNKNLFDSKLITRQQLAERLGTTYARVLGLERKGVPHQVVSEGNGKKNKVVRFDILEVLEWLRARQAAKKQAANGTRTEPRL